MDLLLNPETHDVIFVNGDCPVTQAERDVVAQRLKITLQTFLGEWFLDSSVGIPYYGQILTKLRSKSTIDAIFQRAILRDPAVIELFSYRSEVNTRTRTFHLEFAVKTINNNVIPIDFTVFTGA